MEHTLIDYILFTCIVSPVSLPWCLLSHYDCLYQAILLIKGDKTMTQANTQPNTQPMSTIETVTVNMTKKLVVLRKDEQHGSDKDLLRLTGAIAAGQWATNELFVLLGGKVQCYPEASILPEDREQLQRTLDEAKANVTLLEVTPHVAYRDRMSAIGKWPCSITKSGNSKPLGVDKIRVTYPDGSDARACALAFESLRVLRSNLLKAWSTLADKVELLVNPPAETPDNVVERPVIEALPSIEGIKVSDAVSRLNRLISTMSVDSSLSVFTDELKEIVAELSAE